MSPIPEIVPQGIPLSKDIVGRVHDAVVRITTSRQGWCGPVESIGIRRVIGGGRSGALVLEVVLRAGSERRQRVVKIGSPVEMAAEFANFRRFLGDYPAAVCAPIQEVTDGARDGAGDPASETEAVVYAHVADYVGRSEVSAVTLEDVVIEAFKGSEAELERALSLIAALFTAMATPFHNRQVVRAERSLRDLNPALGPDLVVEPGAVTAWLSYPEDVFQASLGDDGFEPGTSIRLADPAHSAVRVVLRPPWDGPIVGVVVSSRFAERRVRFDAAFGAVEHAAEVVVADGVRTADPAHGLRPVLTDPRLGRVRGVVHGDLNARNVMCVDGRPVLIDFARVADDHPIFADAAWLEISLVRDVFAELSYGELVRVQRLLALASRLQQPGVDDRLAELLEGTPETAFRILAKIRSSAVRAYPREAVAWRDYLAQVHFAAYRTAKWDGPVQTADKLRAVHAAAGVATEWLASDDPFAHWTDPGEVLACVADFADLADPESVDVVTGLVAAVDRAACPAHEENLRELADRYVIGNFVAEAREAVLELSREHDDFLATVPEEPAEPLVLVGGAGSGKTRVLRELAYRAAMDIARPEAGTAGLRMPRLVDARLLLAEGTEGAGLPREALVLGAVRLLVDGVDDVPFTDRERLFRFVAELHGRFPRIAVIVASRDGGQAERAGLRTRQIDRWTPEAAMRFITGSGARCPIPDADLPDLHRELVALGGVTPGMLAMYVDAVRGHGRTIPLAEVHHEYFAVRLGDLEPAGLVEAAELSVDSGGPVPAPGAPEEFFARGILRREGGNVLFNQGIERDFIAAMALESASEDRVCERARRFAWRPIFLLAARLPEVPDSVVTIGVRTVATADPEFAAKLLRLRPSSACCSEFVSAQSAILADPEQGRFAALRAVESLKAVGTPEALRELKRRLTGGTMPLKLMIPSLVVLTREQSSRPEAFPVPKNWLRSVLGMLLDGGRPPESLREVIRVIDFQGVRGLELILAQLVTSADSGVAQAADAELSSLGVVLPGALRTERPRLVAARLAEVERLLPELWTDEEIRTARAERLELLQRLDDPACWLPRLYSYGIRHEVADRLEGRLGDPIDLGALRHLADLDVGDANALAHRIMARHPRRRDELVFAAGPGSPTPVLLIAAAAVRSAATVDHAAQLVARLAEDDTGARIEGLAALAHAVAQADTARGFRVSRSAARRLRERAIPARLHWPWTTMLAYTGPDSSELDTLLADGEVQAVAELATRCTALDGAPDEPARLGEAARHFLLTDRSDDPVVRALALSAAGLVEGLPEIAKLLSDRSLGVTASTISSGQYGSLELAPLAEILPAYGQLARRSGETGPAIHALASVDPTGLHASVADGKAIALGYLGDWVPVVEAAPGDGGRLDAAAWYTLRQWVPGPATPTGLCEPDAIAGWLERRLTDAMLPAGPRSLIQELLFEMESRHGALLPGQRATPDG
ncbi:hypothetical protein [Amycolatopsis sp. NPDC051061]|uniref:hypothetical protein n=1 Tax=Amycolatopsis sp. NPDC051061 TaxID=3155042 RepID=UPI00341C71F9